MLSSIEVLMISLLNIHARGSSRMIPADIPVGSVFTKPSIVLVMPGVVQCARVRTLCFKLTIVRSEWKSSQTSLYSSRDRMKPCPLSVIQLRPM